MIRIILVDDHPLVREGIRGMLAGFDDIEVVGQGASGPEGVALATKLSPDLVLMDLRMPGGDGVTATRQLTASGTARVMVLTTYESDEDILRAIEAGATGYLLKDIAPGALATAIRAAARGETVLAPSVQSALLSRMRQPGPRVPTLSPQEIAVLAGAAQGKTNAAIGTSLHISETTVKTYLGRAYEKLGVGDRTSAVRKAIELRLID
ncbi:two-component system response regulator [Microlunatus phosphovorus NM-1]|uniref:Two-component system response regulator n=1 Tax=Microlunatus phosphovorus (strain ATCC 700054 / DSM 10555 / JCM 9379 / NBRC 101784 / NCIMB 13414 / VKM Ac-1990 / NM-1) TaxID=1032480 RepID=F5XQ36_MICPN|nr:response regulator transcription factor [Microlunatus phosphovorus]BAK36867.1 two-component system response regulator [Microlunatus phosphovorus NM-1]